MATIAGWSGWITHQRKKGSVEKKRTEANLTAVKGAPSVHQPLPPNDGGGGEILYELPIKLFQINKPTSKSNVHRLKESVQVIRASFVGNRLGESACASSSSSRVNEDSAQ